MEKEKANLASLPHSPGVYIYRDINDTVIYVGKAVDLRKRISQYFQRDDALGLKTKALVEKIAKIEIIKTAGEFDALLLEAKLIHDLQPHYNSLAKDDKSPIYILLTTDEELPRVLLVRKTGLPATKSHGPVIFGPFQSSWVTRELLRRSRRIIPFCTQKERNGKPCFYTHLHLCDPCPSVIIKMPDSPLRKKEVLRYRRNIMRLKALLSGKSTNVRLELEKDMRLAAKNNLFEEAQLIKGELESLSGIESARFDPTMYLTRVQLADDANLEEITQLLKILQPYYPDLQNLTRIECIDISNISGTLSTGSLVVLTDGLIDTHEYRKFRIRRKETPNDTAMVSEVVNRRMKHHEWPKPDLLVIDGGKGQVSAAVESLNSLKLDIPVIGLAKRFEEIVVPLNGDFKVIRISPTSPAIHLLQRIRDEAHRFARNYHLLLRSKAFTRV